MCNRLEKEMGAKSGIESVSSLWKRINKDFQLYLSLKTQVEHRNATTWTGKLNREGIRVHAAISRY